jgi:selenocysteine lyase/cysteine desulfurase
MHCPPGYGPRPRDTGWYAAFGALTARQTGVPYGEDGTRFLGATFDPSGLYRQRAVFTWMEHLGLTVEAIHGHVLALQERFLAALEASRLETLKKSRLITPMSSLRRGHFLTFETERAAALYEDLLRERVVTDVRGNRIRFGFGCYHTNEDIERAMERMADRVPA